MNEKKKVLLIGDSIRLSYQNQVSEMLSDIADVYYPGENSRFTKYALWSLVPFVAECKIDRFDCIHWNTGIWDMHRSTVEGNLSTVEEYVHDMERLYSQLASMSDKLIFSSNTPGGRDLDRQKAVYDAGGTGTFFLVDSCDAWNRDIVAYNEAVRTPLLEHGVIYNDLYSLINANIENYISDDGIHLTPAGVKAAATMVSGVIRSVL